MRRWPQLGSTCTPGQASRARSTWRFERGFPLSLLDLYRSQLQQQRTAIVRDRHTVTDLGEKIRLKQKELERATTAGRQRSLQQELDRLRGRHTRAQTSVDNRNKKIQELEAKAERELGRAARRAEQDRQRTDRAQDLARRKLESSLATTHDAVSDLQGRIAELEAALLDRVREEIATDPVPRAHDVFLSHAGPDLDLAEALYVELTGRGLDVWFDGAVIRLGDPLTRQLDIGIARSRLGVVLITPAFLEGRYWTELEVGGLIATKRRVIPVLDGVERESLSSYSPFLANFVGLSTEQDDLGSIAEKIAATLASAEQP